MEKSNGDDGFAVAMQLASSSVLPMALRAAMELGLFEIIAKSGPHNFLSPAEIASHLPTRNPDAPVMIDRILRFLASSSILECKITKNPDHGGGGEEIGERLYGLKPVCKYFVGDEDGVSLAPHFLFLQDKVVIDSWYQLKDAVVNGGIPFNIAHGMSAFEFPARDDRFNKVFNQAMYNVTSITLKMLLQVYKGFEGLTEIIDVGGGSGATLAAIISKYPHIKGVNFDLPHVIKNAPHCQGVEHVAGDMFENVPSGKVIFMKYILHDWSDDQCLKLLKNCRKALAESGKLIVMEAILPEYPEIDKISNDVFRLDLTMLTMNPGGKERTEREFEALATRAGFAATKNICRVHNKCVIEFYKM